VKQGVKFIFEFLRVKQWVKNAFIFFPLIFSGKLFEDQALVNSLIAFLGFCLTASSLYILNDYLDRDKDRLHPRKSQRPLARLNVPGGTVKAIIVFLVMAGLLVSWQVNAAVFAAALFYIALHLGYNFLAKRVVLIDVMFIALGFQVRVWAGALAIEVSPSVGLQLCVFILALFLGFTKRRHEIKTLGDTAAHHRGVLSHYTVYLLDQIIIICSTLAIVFYGLYTMSAEMIARLGHSMVYTVIFVIYGIFRYLYLSHVKKGGDDPGEVLAADAPLLINVLLWILAICYLLYNPLR
jgi:4-hydroxybenzoate polyprenyltransferase